MDEDANVFIPFLLCSVFSFLFSFSFFFPIFFDIIYAMDKDAREEDDMHDDDSMSYGASDNEATSKAPPVPAGGGGGGLRERCTFQGGQLTLERCLQRHRWQHLHEQHQRHADCCLQSDRHCEDKIHMAQHPTHAGSPHIQTVTPQTGCIKPGLILVFDVCVFGAYR